MEAIKLIKKQEMQKDLIKKEVALLQILSKNPNKRIMQLLEVFEVPFM